MTRRRIETYANETDWYNSEDGVDRLSSWYRDAKEAAFTRFVADKAPFPGEGPIVEIGGGTGIQGLHWKRLFGARYLHSDYAEPMVAKATSLGLQSQVVDGLNMPFDDGSISGLLMIGTSTIIWDQEMRAAQIREASRVLRPGGIAVLVSSRVAWIRYGRGFKRSDLRALRDAGFDILLFRDWGIIPGRFWARGTGAFFAACENILSPLSLGIRRTIIIRKTALPTGH